MGGKERKRSRALGPVPLTSDAARAAIAAQPPSPAASAAGPLTRGTPNTHERAATSDATTTTTTTSSHRRCHETAARLREGRTHKECSAGGALQAKKKKRHTHPPAKPHNSSSALISWSNRFKFQCILLVSSKSALEPEEKKKIHATNRISYNRYLDGAAATLFGFFFSY